jgi:GDP-D-mannose 3', 5'-epimerase
MSSDVLIAGGGGFIGGHLAASLLQQGKSVRVVDVKPQSQWQQHFPDADNIEADLQEIQACRLAARGVQEIYNLAADMGGMGFIENNKAACMLSSLVSTHMLMAARDEGAERLFYSSSACVYAAEKQTEATVIALKEADAYPAMPEDGYGWEKLFSERMCRHFSEDYGLETRVARYHNVYGPLGTYTGGREKAPAAICRKVIEAVLSKKDTIEIWGDGEQTRSFMYVEDCVRGSQMIMQGQSSTPVNLGSNELVTINQLVSVAEQIAGVTLERQYLLDAPKGVRGRNSDNTMIRQMYGWEPTISLQEGLERTYAWVFDQMSSDGVGAPRDVKV